MSELRSGQVLHAYLGILAAGLDSAPRMVRLTFPMVDRDGEVHVLNLFFFIPVRTHATKRRLLDLRGGLPLEGLLPIAYIPLTSLTVWRAVKIVPREYHVVHVEGIPPLNWHTIPCKRAGRKIDGLNLDCRGITFLLPDVAAHLLGNPGTLRRRLNFSPPFCPFERLPTERLWIGCSLPTWGTGLEHISRQVQPTSPFRPLFATDHQQLYTL